MWKGKFTCSYSLTVRVWVPLQGEIRSLEDEDIEELPRDKGKKKIYK